MNKYNGISVIIKSLWDNYRLSCHMGIVSGSGLNREFTVKTTTNSLNLLTSNNINTTKVYVIFTPQHPDVQSEVQVVYKLARSLHTNEVTSITNHFSKKISSTADGPTWD